MPTRVSIIGISDFLFPKITNFLTIFHDEFKKQVIRILLGIFEYFRIYDSIDNLILKIYLLKSLYGKQN